MIGRTLGHYRITTSIGAGGMGEVYRATDTKLGRDVALKVLPAAVARDPERLERFQREAKALAALDHPNIVTIYSVEETGGVHFLTMQLVEGQPLDRLIPEGGLPVERLLAIGEAIADALAAAHERSIVHRDLKPANVMVTTQGRVKVLDFGLAKVVHEGARANVDAATALLTRDGVVMGTVPYMSPEQVAGRTVGPRTDIFSLGVILYELASGQRPFKGDSSAELASAILRDTPPPLGDVRPDLPADLARTIRRCLEKDPPSRIQTARDVGNELRELARAPAPTSEAKEAERPHFSSAREAREGKATGSGAARLEEGFWVAVLPCRYTGANADLTALAEGLTEESVTGLSRFSYLRVIAHSSTARYANSTTDVRVVGKELGARYVMEGSLRQAGARLRLAVQLVDAGSGAHLWAETYDRPFGSEEIFALQDDLVSRIVATVADTQGVLPHIMSEALRSRDPETLTPYEAVLRSFAHFQRANAEEHAASRAGLERAVQKAPGYADAWAMLSLIYKEEFTHEFNLRPDPVGRAFAAAQRATDAAPSNHLAYHALAAALFFRRELQPFRNAAERALTLNPMDGFTLAYLGFLIAYSGDWERGCALAERARSLNPSHPGWYWFPAFFDAYRKSNYRGALDVALKVNMPGFWRTQLALATSYGQLGEREPARAAVRSLLALRPDFAERAHEELGKWWDPALVLHLIDGLHKAGMDIQGEQGEGGQEAREGTVAIAVLPFSDMSPAKDQDYLCEGMAEEIMNALVRIDGISVVSRTSAFRARQEYGALAAIASALSVNHVLEGSVRSFGGRLRVTAQLTNVASGYQLWSERFDRDAADVFAVEDEIAGGVVEAVKARLAPGARIVQVRSQAHNLEAYRCYLKGRHLRHTIEDHAAALLAFQEAIRLDPTYAPAWTGLAEINVLAAHFSLIPAREACDTARQALQTAERLQGPSPDALHVEAFVAFIERRWQAMEAAFGRALDLQPTHVQALAAFGVMLSTRQKLEEALPLFDRAEQADPLAAFPYSLRGAGLLVCGKREECLRCCDDALSFEHDNLIGLWVSAMAKVARGDFDEGIARAERAVAVSQRGPFFLGILGWALAAAGRNDDARTILAELRARPASAPTTVSEAWLLGVLGEVDTAFEVVARAEEECQAFLYYTGLPAFDPLRADPRFAALLGRLGLSAGSVAGSGA